MRGVLKAVYDAIPAKRQLFRGLRPLGLPPRLYRHLHFHGVFPVDIPESAHRFRMMHFGYELENELFWNGLYGTYEGRSMRVWVELCKRARSIVDVGANTGLYSLVAKTVNPAAMVTAFEPVERVYQKLLDNIRLNRLDVQTHALALSDRSGEAFYFDTMTEHAYSFTVNKNVHAPDIAVEKRPLHTVTLDDFIARSGLERIDLIKIDGETHEPEVLEGFAAHLDRFHPDMLIEVLDADVARRLNRILAGTPYLYYDVDEAAGPRRIAKIEQSGERNILACSAESARALGLS